MSLPKPSDSLLLSNQVILANTLSALAVRPDGHGARVEIEYGTDGGYHHGCAYVRTSPTRSETTTRCIVVTADKCASREECAAWMLLKLEQLDLQPERRVSHVPEGQRIVDRHTRASGMHAAVKL